MRSIMICGLSACLFACSGFGPSEVDWSNDADAGVDNNGGGNDGDNNPNPPDGLDCSVAADCDDGKKNTTDTCVDGRCVHEDIVCQPGFTLSPTGQCVMAQPTCEDPDDGDPCTVDSCDPQTGETVHAPKCESPNPDEIHVFCVPDTGACVLECIPDDDPCTTEEVTRDGECNHTPITCDEGERCLNGTCEPGPCTDNAQCQDHNPCTRDSCQPLTGACLYEPNADVVCDDQDPTTRDLCERNDLAPGGRTCEHLPEHCVPPADDGNACTIEACDENGPTQFEQNCDDNDPSTDDSCVSQNGACQHAQRCAPGTLWSLERMQCVPAQAAPNGNCEEQSRHCMQFEANQTTVYAVCVGGNWVELENCGPLNGGHVCGEGVGCLERPAQQQ